MKHIFYFIVSIIIINSYAHCYSNRTEANDYDFAA